MGMKDVLMNILKNAGYKLLEISTNETPSKTDPNFKVLYERCKDYTMTSEQSMFSLYTAVQYVIQNKIPGDFVECGVWKGGSSMLAALTLQLNKITDKNLYLYDTYLGMSKPTEEDISIFEDDPTDRWESQQKSGYNRWCYSPIEEVKENMFKTGYPKDKIFFIKGKVEDTIPQSIPDKISILRLDTDWYESTYHELCHLFPLLSKDGVLIIDDYGHWKGSKKAVDEYLKEYDIKILLNPVDYTARMAVK